MIIKATSNTIKSIWLFFLFIILICILIFGILSYGIRIESFEIASVKLEQLYIKLDKKLIVTVDTLDINSSQESNLSLEESAKIIDNFFLIDQLFASIDIEKLHYKGEQYKVHFSDQTFFVQGNAFNIHMQLTPTDHNAFDIDILQANIAPLHLEFSGKGSINLEKKYLSFENTFTLFGLQGIALIDIKKDLLHYHVQSENFTHTTLNDIMNFIASKSNLDPLVKAWIHEKVIAESYKLHFLEGLYNFKTKDFSPQNIYAKASLDKAQVFFEPTLPAAHIEHLDITLKNDDLMFDINGTTYEDKALEKVDIVLYHVIAKGTSIVINLKANSPLDNKIHKILHAFKINIPIVQTTGSTQSNVNLDIKFLPFGVKAKGSFHVLPSTFLLDGLAMSTKSAEVFLEDTSVSLKNTNLRYKDLFDLNTTGVLNLKTDHFKGLVDINSLILAFGKTNLLKITNLKQQEVALSLENNATTITLPTLDTSLSFKKNLNQFECNTLKKLHPYSDVMKEMELEEGKVFVSTKDFEHFDANLILNNIETPLLENGHPIKDLTLHLSTDGVNVDLKTPNQKLTARMAKETTVYINDLNISVPKDQTTSETQSAITIIGKNSSFELQEGEKKVLSDRYTLKLKGKDLLLTSHYKKTLFEMEKKKKLFLLHANDMDAHFTNALFGHSYFQNGNFSLQIEGADDTHNQGTFILQKTHIKDLKFFNNLMATINAIPSLVFFNDPSFSNEGYFVDSGYIEFEQNKDKFKIKEIHLKGASADIFGVGTVDTSANTLHLDLQIRTLKTFSSILDKIPLVGGLILGEDKKISTNITVTGKLDDPSIETHLVSDTLMTPVNIIKRTIELPFEIFK